MRRISWQQLIAAGKKGSVAATAFSALAMQQIATFVIILIAARFLAPAEYGLYTLSLVFIQLIQTLTYSGFFHFIITEKGDEKRILNTSFWLILGISVIASIVVGLSAPGIALVFDAPKLEHVVVLLALNQPLSSIVAWISAILMRQKRMQAHYTIMIIENVSSLAVGIALLVVWQSVYALVAFRFAKSIIGAVLFFGYTRVLPALEFDKKIAKTAASYASGIYGSRFLNFFANYGADLILGFVYSTAEAGLYRFGSRLATAAMDIVAHPLRSFALAQFGAANRNDTPYTPLLAKFMSTALFMMGGIAIALFAFGAQIIELLFRPEYMAALGVTYALALRSVLSIGDGFSEAVLASKSKTGVIMTHHGFWAAIQVVVIAVTATLGMNTLAWSQASVALATSSVALFLVVRYAGIDIMPVLVSMGKTLLCLAGVGLAIMVIQTTISNYVGDLLLSLAISFAISLSIGLFGLALAYKLKIVSLSVFAD